jgi:hypothetical protein
VVILSDNIFDLKPEAIRNAKVEAAIPAACSIGGGEDFDPQILPLAPALSEPKKFTQRRRFFFPSPNPMR